VRKTKGGTYAIRQSSAPSFFNNVAIVKRIIKLSLYVDAKLVLCAKDAFKHGVRILCELDRTCSWNNGMAGTAALAGVSADLVFFLASLN
jgi:hypothetical protein